jgi:hypothetical protein
MAEAYYSFCVAFLLSIKFSENLLVLSYASALTTSVTNFEHEDIVGSVDQSNRWSLAAIVNQP